MTYYVLAYDRAKHELIERHEFLAERRDVAWAKREALIVHYLLDGDVEVVLLGAESEEDLRATHGRYFERVVLPDPV